MNLWKCPSLGYYETVTYSLTPSENSTILDVQVEEKSWGPNYLSFGLGYEDNFNSDTRFNVAAALQVTELNALGGEWTTGLQLGTEPRVRSEWFQPLDYGYRRFMLSGIDTFMGPVQLATAHNHEDRWTAYLNIGFSLERLFD